MAGDPRVRYFLMGANEWRTAETWPPRGGLKCRFYLQKAKTDGETGGEGDKGTRGQGDKESRVSVSGLLSQEKPVTKEKPDRFVYDPSEPTPSVGGNTLYSVTWKGAGGEEAPDFGATAGPRDQRSIEGRGLTYTSEPLAAPLDVVGQVTCTLYASSDCVDTDFVVRLTDVFPDGRSIQVVDGILRARYRKSRTRARLLKPGKVYRFRIDLWFTAWRFDTGHRLRLGIAGSNFPRFDRNLNTGKAPTESRDVKVATNAIYIGKKYPSHLTVGVIE
jgi:putative CocE/NonD family hydrolase